MVTNGAPGAPPMDSESIGMSYEFEVQKMFKWSASVI